MDTTEKNKLIAEFMEYEVSFDEKTYYIPSEREGMDIKRYFVEDCKYHTSWDWLMPVVDKIEGLKLGDVVIETLFDDEDLYRDANAYFRIEHSSAYIDLCGTMKLYESIISIEGKPTKIEATYKAAVEFIKWYNDKNK